MTTEPDWRKATASNQSNCVEVAWRTAAASGNSNCVQAAASDGRVLIRDSKDPDGPVLGFTPAEFAAFRDGCAGGEFDDLTGP